MNRRDFLHFCGRSSLTALFTQKLSASQLIIPSDGLVRIGYLPIIDATALLVAHGMGYFQKEGLKVARPTLIRGWSPLVEGFLGNKFNLVHLLNPIPIWMRYHNDIPVKVVAWAHTNGSALVVGRHIQSDHIKDLGGRQIAVPYWYSVHNMLLQKELRHHGLTPVIQPQNKKLASNEVNLQILPPPEMPAALAAKKIDGYIVAEPFNALGELKAGGRILRFTGDMWRNHPCCVITMHQRHTQEQQDWSQRIVNAIVKAQIYASKNKDEVARLLSKQGEGYIPLPYKIIKRAMLDYDEKQYHKIGANRNKDQWHNSRIDFQPWPYPSATKAIIKEMKNTLVTGDTKFLQALDPEFVAADLVDYRYVKKALNDNPQWLDDPSVIDKKNPFSRQELFDF